MVPYRYSSRGKKVPCQSRTITSINNVNPTVAESLRPKVELPVRCQRHAQMLGCLDAWMLGNNTHGPNPTSSSVFYCTVDY